MKFGVVTGLSIVLGVAALPVAAAESDGGITAASFQCIRDMTPVRGFFVDNLKGDLKGTVAAANAPNGAPYPPGSVVQLVPGEVMVKREKGFNAATRDWEFFELDVTKDSTSIRGRGFVDIVNRFGGNCFACHIKAKPEFDLVCENNHGCDPIPLTAAMIKAIQKTDPRCPPAELTADETAALKALQAAIAKPAT